MAQSSVATSKKIIKLTRVKRNESTKRRIFDAAAKVVGQYGYAEASIARITDMAGVAQGTFYNHFESRQELLDQLLPSVGIDMVNFIRERTRTDGNAIAREIDRFRAFFDFMREAPEFLRILNEAEFFAPAGYQKHFDNIITAFAEMLRRARDAGDIHAISDDEIEAAVHILMGARGYLSRRYSHSDNDVGSVPEHVITAYENLLTRGLFSKPRKGNRKS